MPPRKGYKQTEEHKRKNSLAKMGSRNPMFGKKSNANQLANLSKYWGKTKLSEEGRKRLRESKLGKNNPHYGKSPSKETIEKWRKSREGYRHSEETRKKISISRLGEKNWNWKGGITTLITCIKTTPIAIQWRKNVMGRDYFTCQECGVRNGNGKAIYLEAHHINPLSKILKEFLLRYKYLNPIKDKQQLIQLALTYEPFWDITNGKTLCEVCHDKITYAKNNR